jgi:hypothetical protein
MSSAQKRAFATKMTRFYATVNTWEGPVGEI